MSRKLQTFGLVAMLCGAGCGTEPPQPEPLRPVRWERAVTSTADRTRSFSGVARAGRETNLSFRVSGRIESIEVRVGNDVRRGTLLAQLERTDFEIAVRQAEATRDERLAAARNASADLDRIRGLWENNNASRNDLDQALAQAQSAKAQVEVAEQSLAQSRRKLGYAGLRAPIDGFVAEVPAEVSENVTQGQTIVRMTSGSEPEVEVAIPEVLIAQVREGASVDVRLSAFPGREFPAVVTEVGVAATGTATTFPVTVRLGAVGSEVRSGMAAEVTFVFDDGGEDGIYLPAYAVGEDRQGRFVFVVEETAESEVGVVHRVAVEIGVELTPEGKLHVLAGLEPGRRVVTAGVRRLTDGQRVRLPSTGIGS